MRLPRFLGRLFGKRAPADTDPARDAEGWQVGDLAECINAGGWFTIDGAKVDGPRQGQVAKVLAVHLVSEARLPGGKVLALEFAGWPDDAFTARCFRKLRPRADAATPAEEAFTRLVRRPPTPVMPTEKIEELQ